MERNINITAILKDKPQGTKLYDWLRNIDVRLNKVQTTDVVDYIECTSIDKEGNILLDYSKLGTEINWLNGLQILKPSKEMRDWSKFAWKKGDILINGDKDVHIIFEAFENDTYTRFKGKHYLWKEGNEEDYCKEEIFLLTSVFEKANNDAVKCYINTIEERLGGKLNMKTLEIEKSQPEFKDGDIVAVDLERKNIRIFKEKENENNFCRGKYYIGFSFNDEGKLIQTFENYRADCTSDRLATEEEKQQLFDALAKGNKAWDAEKKIIVDLKHKIGFKPFDKVIVFDETKKEWKCDIFSNKTKDANGDVCALCIGGVYYNILPYEGNESLLGTTKDVED